MTPESTEQLLRENQTLAINRLLHLSGLSMRAFAKRAGTSVAAISHARAGKRKISMELYKEWEALAKWIKNES